MSRKVSSITLTGRTRPPVRTRVEAELPPLTDVVAGHPFFRGMTEPQLRILGECAARAEFVAGELIFRRGEAANRFYLIEAGEVSVELPATGQGTIFIQTVGVGEECGWSWLFPPYHWHFDARAVRPTRAIYFYGSWLRELCNENAEFGRELMQRMAQVQTTRLHAAHEHLAALSQLALESECHALELAGKELGKRSRQPSKKK